MIDQEQGERKHDRDSIGDPTPRPRQASTGPALTTRSRSSMSAVSSSNRSPSPTPHPACANSCDSCTARGHGEVAIERPDGPVVDVLLEAGFGVIVIAPNQLKNLRSRYGSAGNKDDGFDAYVLADTLRTDRARLRPLTRDSDATLTLRFLTRFPSQDKADWLSWARLGNWLRSVGYNRMHNLDLLWHHLHDAPRGTTGPEGTTRAHITLALVAGLTTLPTQINALEDQIADQLAAHPDAAIFTSLPRSGTVRAARLLAEIGDARGRFPTPEALTCLAGAAPSTRQSGKLKIVAFRWAVDKQLRGVVIDFAGDSHHANPWAADL
jgi:transposase